jgi:hypothetical protein
MPRMNILNAVEREAFDSPPAFTSVQRKQYFDFPSGLHRLARSLRTSTHQLCFLLNAGYFRAAKRFFPPCTFHRRDIEYVAGQIELAEQAFDLADYSRRTRQFHQHVIRSFYGFRLFDPKTCRLLREEIAGMVRAQHKPKVIF